MWHEHGISHVPLRPKVMQFSFLPKPISDFTNSLWKWIKPKWHMVVDHWWKHVSQSMYTLCVCACKWALGPQGTCERGEGEGGERAPVGLSLSQALWLCRGATLQWRNTLPCVHSLQLRVHTCHLRVEGTISWLAHNRCDTFALKVCCF